jgi:hypothetical protein
VEGVEDAWGGSDRTRDGVVLACVGVDLDGTLFLFFSPSTWSEGLGGVVSMSAGSSLCRSVSSGGFSGCFRIVRW